MKNLTAALNMLLLVAFGVALAVVAMTHETPRLGGEATQVEVWDVEQAREAEPVNTPRWAWARDEFPECVSVREWNASVASLPKDDLRRMPSFFVTVHLDGTMHRETAEVAWERSHTAARGTYWVIGACGA